MWDVRAVKPLDPEMLADAAGHPAVRHRRGRPPRRRRRRGHAPTPSSSAATVARRSRCSASRSGYIPHGKPDAILADLGLDAAGIAASARAAAALHGAPSLAAD